METKLNEYSLKITKTNFNKVKIGDSKDAVNYIRQFYFDDIDIYESSFILLLNHSGMTIGYAKISQGGVTGTIIDPKIVFKYVIDSLATRFIICHNHPSGNTKPSDADKQITYKLKEFANLIDVNLLDHIILTSDSFYSFMEEGLL